MRAAKAATAADGVPLRRSPGGPRPAAPRRQARPAGGARAAAPRRRALDVDPAGGTAARGSSAVYSWSCHHAMSYRPEESVGTPHEVTAEGDFKGQEAHGSLPDSSQNLHFWPALPPSLPAGAQGSEETNHGANSTGPPKTWIHVSQGSKTLVI